jgi:hypothetical protein
LDYQQTSSWELWRITALAVTQPFHNRCAISTSQFSCVPELSPGKKWEVTRRFHEKQQWNGQPASNEYYLPQHLLHRISFRGHRRTLFDRRARPAN